MDALATNAKSEIEFEEVAPNLWMPTDVVRMKKILKRVTEAYQFENTEYTLDVQA